MKIKTFRLQTSKLLGNRRKAYVLDVICFGSSCGGQGISAPRKEGLFVYQWSVPEKKKQSGRGNAFVNTPQKFLVLARKFWENRSSLQV